jgi:hypothetical protein
VGANLLHFLVVRILFVATSLLALNLLRGVEATNAPFSIQQRDETAWFVRPDGERFFSLGVCVANQGASREEFNPTSPGYAAFQWSAFSTEITPAAN